MQIHTKRTTKREKDDEEEEEEKEVEEMEENCGYKMSTTATRETTGTFTFKTRPDKHGGCTAGASTRCPFAAGESGARALIATLLTLAALATCCSAAYQFPIQHRPLHRPHQSVQQPQLQNTMPAAKRRIDEPVSDEGEQLRQLHQVVDTMAELLNEDEQHQQRQREANFGGGQPRQLSSGAGRQQTLKAEEALSEGAIRQALEDLERMQQQERDQSSAQLSEAESIDQSSIVAPPGGYAATIQQQQEQQQQKAQQASASQQSKQSALESLIDELGDELISEEQLEAATQEAERMLRNQAPGTLHHQSVKGREFIAESRKLDREVGSPNNEHDDIKRSESSKIAQPFDESKLIEEAKSGGANSMTSSASASASASAPALAASSSSQQQANKASPSSSSLYVGQLDPANSELGTALTNDFYNFHAESSGMNSRSLSGTEPHPASQQQVGAAQNDLEPAAQTRNSISRHEPQSSPFEQDSSLRFDFNQPAPIDGPPQAQRGPQDSANQEALVRAFRQQVGADTSHFGPPPPPPPTSTLIPLGADNFWRPTSSNHNQDVPTGDLLGQQYSRAHSGATQNTQLPPLPAARFQPPPGAGGQSAFQQQQQPVASSRQPQHIHFTGHSFVHSNGQPQFTAAQQHQPAVNSRPGGYSSTSAPIISVLSGSDTSSGNSVSWNPPASINPPSAVSPNPTPLQQQQQQQAFNQQFSAPINQLPPGQDDNNNNGPALFPPASRGSPMFSVSPFHSSRPEIHSETGSTPSIDQAANDFRLQQGNSFATSTEVASQPPIESTTTMRELDRFVSPIGGQWSQPTGGVGSSTLR